MKGRIIIGIVSLAVLGVIAAGAALATPPSGLVGTPLARGSAGEFTIHDKSQKLKLQTKGPLDVAFVKATLTANGFTGWHSHNAPSLLVLKMGSLTVYEAGDSCSAETYGANDAFVHVEDAHNFVAGPDGAEFYIAYLLPEGASPAAIDVPQVPDVCS